MADLTVVSPQDFAGSPRDQCLRRLKALQQERQSWIDHWRDLNEYFQPRRARFLAQDRNKGGKKNTSIITNVAPWAAKTLAAGMMSGLTSPARPWFKLTTPDPSLDKSAGVRAWLDDVADLLRLTFARSNIYNALHSQYGEIGIFGTSAMFVEEDDHTILRAYVQPIGQYALATSERGVVDTVYRELSMSVMQLVQKFGLDRCSDTVKGLYQQRRFDEWVEVVHVIEPRPTSAGKALSAKDKPWSSCWYELKGDEKTGSLRDSGFDTFPALCPRWEVTGEDVYGSSPGMEALGDARAIQLIERRKAQAIDKIVNPPMRGPSSLMNKRSSLLPGDTTYVDVIQGGQTFEPAITVPPVIVEIIGQQSREHGERIKSSMYADLWLLLADREEGDPQKTAREVAELHEEKMLQLGPVLERLQGEQLDPLIERAFGILMRRGRIPKPPPELQGQPLRVEYISILAQAQKLVGIAGLERFAGFVGNLAGVNQAVLDKVNFDGLVDEYAEALGIPASVIVDDEQVQAIRAHREQQAQAQQQGQAAMALAQGAQTLSQADTGGDNALTRLLGTMGAPRLPAGADGGGA